MLRAFVSSLKQEFSGYNASALTKDLMAGLTVAAVALPLALAFGVSSGADAASGLITAIIYAGAAFAPKIAVIGVAGLFPALISRYL